MTTPTGGYTSHTMLATRIEICTALILCQFALASDDF